MTDLVRQEIAATADTIVVKIGTRPLTGDDGLLDEARIALLASEINALLDAGRRVVLVSSGAVGAGMGQLGLKNRPGDVAHLQAVAAVGQSYLVQTYNRALRVHNRHAAQVLLTADDLDERTRYLNVRNTLVSLLEMGAVPIVNENDTVSVDELLTTFGDNDHLAALVTNLLRAPLLVILSDVDGLYDGDPADPGSQRIELVKKIDSGTMQLAQAHVAGLSKGGMASKLRAARIATAGGENVIIASGKTPGVLGRIVAGETVGTLFLAQGSTITARKRWIGLTVQPRGYLVLDDGARRAIETSGRSLLAIGVTETVGDFAKGDVVALRDRLGQEFARGLTNYTADELRRIQGLRTEQIAAELGHCPYEELIHRDNLVLTG
ncbi:MAG: glutamate 5-kinase [Pirellulales bacterium]|nr:glutamate 5-kinase [Planctomycetales bacterium]